MFIDIHTHILPYIDDGADSWEHSLKMLRQGESSGIVAAVATPHILSENDYRVEAEVKQRFQELKKKAKKNNINMDLFLGSEIYVQPEMTLNHQISTINDNKKYFLVEFPMTSIPKFAADIFFNFIVDEKIPIIAHPERNLGFQNKSFLAFEFVQRGALMQINARSLLGRQGESARSLAFNLISHNLAHFIASDCHDPRHRIMELNRSYNIVLKNWGAERAKMLFYKNPYKAIQGEKIEILDPLPIKKETNPPLGKKLLTFFFKYK